MAGKLEKSLRKNGLGVAIKGVLLKYPSNAYGSFNTNLTNAPSSDPLRFCSFSILLKL